MLQIYMYSCIYIYRYRYMNLYINGSKKKWEGVVTEENCEGFEFVLHVRERKTLFQMQTHIHWSGSLLKAKISIQLENKMQKTHIYT